MGLHVPHNSAAVPGRQDLLPLARTRNSH